MEMVRQLREVWGFWTGDPCDAYIMCMDNVGIHGGFLKWWVSPTTMGFPTKNDHFGVFWGTTI